MNNFLLLAIVTYVTIVATGYWLNRFFPLPWMFFVVLLGLGLSTLGLLQETIQGDFFLFLPEMSVLFFIIGLGLEFAKISHLDRRIVIGNILPGVDPVKN